ncbi:MAG TPA: DUF711 family protein [Ktedonobacterales bacterium]|nr:DUF711 family protein [Ktedonobacterales bacterium]
MAPIIVRTITLGIGAAHPLDAASLTRAGAFLRQAQTAMEQAGYTVQTTRIATRPLLADLADWDNAAVVGYAASLQAMCAAEGIAFCSLGPAPADDPSFPLARLALLPDILVPHPALNAAVQLASVANGVRYEAAQPTAGVMRALAAHDGGMVNFRFAALAMCEPGGPFFPQAYHRGDTWTVSVGLQGAGLVREALATLAAQTGTGAAAMAGASVAVANTLTAAATPVVERVRELATDAGFGFAGIDLSPAPMGDDSIAGAFEVAGAGLFGEPGTLALAAAVTRGIRSAGLPLCGYCGLMLPPLEDAVLGKRCAEGLLSISSLLSLSSVCGTGLDTVPLAGDVPAERVAALLMDVAGLAARLHKPLSARLFIVPGAHPGELTHFDSPYLTNTRVLAL